MTEWLALVSITGEESKVAKGSVFRIWKARREVCRQM